jgi:arylsulfatase A
MFKTAFSAPLISLLFCFGLFGEDRLPNVVLIMADDMGYECLGTYGSTSYQTPNLDSLAAKGVRFDHCYSTPLCTPSRVQIMTGRYNCFTYDEFGYLDPAESTFGHMMQDAGYATMIAGKWQLNGISHGKELMRPGGMDNRRPLQAGFDECSLWQVTKGKREGERFWDTIIEQNGEVIEPPAEKYGPDLFTDYICDFIERKKDEPFFVYYPMVLVHDPFIYTPDSKTKELSQQDAFADMVAYADKLVGRIHDQLEQLGLLENTLLIFTGDNGTNTQLRSQLGQQTIKGGKGKTIDAGIHVPLVAYWKDHTQKGQVSQQLIDFTDFRATLADLIGLSKSKTKKSGLDGVSFLPTLEGKQGAEREWVFCFYEPRWGQFRSNRSKFVYDGQYKVYHDGRLFNVTKDLDEIFPLDSKALPGSVHQRLQSVLDRYPDFPAEETPFGEALLPKG